MQRRHVLGLALAACLPPVFNAGAETGLSILDVVRLSADAGQMRDAMRTVLDGLHAQLLLADLSNAAPGDTSGITAARASEILGRLQRDTQAIDLGSSGGLMCFVSAMDTAEAGISGLFLEHDVLALGPRADALRNIRLQASEQWGAFKRDHLTALARRAAMSDAIGELADQSKKARERLRLSPVPPSRPAQPSPGKWI